MRGIRVVGTSVVAGMVLLAPAMTAFAGGGLQKPPTGQMQKSPMQIERKVDPNAVRVEVQSLIVTVGSSTTAATTLRSGDQVKVTMIIKNAGGNTVARVPWSIQVSFGNIAVLGSGQEMDMAPGATRSVVSQPWTATAGERVFQGFVDPSNNIQNTAPAAARKKELAFNVVLVSAATQGSGGAAPLVTQMLDYQKAKAAGAQFANSPEGGTEHCGVAQSPLSGGSVQFSADCRASAVGIRATPEAFMNFQLRNGWKIKSIDTFEIEPLKKDHGDWQWRQRPSVGSDAPGLKMHIWAEGPRPPLGYSGWVYVGVRITIEGPQNTNPYE